MARSELSIKLSRVVDSLLNRPELGPNGCGAVIVDYSNYREWEHLMPSFDPVMSWALEDSGLAYYSLGLDATRSFPQARFLVFDPKRVGRPYISRFSGVVGTEGRVEAIKDASQLSETLSNEGWTIVTGKPIGLFNQLVVAAYKPVEIPTSSPAGDIPASNASR